MSAYIANHFLTWCPLLLFFRKKKGVYTDYYWGILFHNETSLYYFFACRSLHAGLLSTPVLSGSQSLGQDW